MSVIDYAFDIQRLSSSLTVVADFVLVDVLAAVGLGSGRALSGLGEGNEGEDREDDAGETHFDSSLEADSGTVVNVDLDADLGRSTGSTAGQPVFYIQQALSRQQLASLWKTRLMS